MECQEARAKMFSYLDQELSLQEEEALFSHLSNCLDCGLEFGAVEETHYLLQKVLVPVVPPLDLTERIMAQIPLPLEQHLEESTGLGFRLKQYMAGIGQRWKDARSSWQLRTAMVTMGLLAVFAFGSMSNMLDLQTPKKQTPDIAQVDPGDKEEQETVGDNTPVDTPLPIPDDTSGGEDKPDSEVDKSPGEDTVDNQGGEVSDIPPKEEQKPTKVVPDSTTNIVELPQAASGETRVETIEVVSLIESTGQNMSHPVLTGDGHYIHYLYDNAGMEEEWEIELKSGAVPQKAQSNLVLGNESEGEADRKVPQWLSDMDMMKEAKSKTVAWSSDKKQLAINLNTSGTDNDGLWIAQSDGVNIAHVVPEGGGNNLAWSPNGMKIAFTDGADNLYVLYLRENLLIQVTNSRDKLTNLKHLFWTPDGQEIIFEGKKAADGIREIYRVVLP